MADIFISYSIHERDKASKLCQRLRSSGYTVWLDETNISAAAQWSNEIVKAIEECVVFIILLSKHSFSSHNVIKELSLASEDKKHIVPVELEPVDLTHDVKYQLAGIQRVQYKNFDHIEAAVKRFLGHDQQAAQPHIEVPKMVSKYSRRRILKLALAILLLAVAAALYLFLIPAKQKTVVAESKTLAVLPFESLSAEKENVYFTDGLTTELSDMLSHIKGIRVANLKSTMEYKGAKEGIKSIAEALGVRYIVNGTVRRQGNSIKITVQMSDAMTGALILSKQFDGTMNDVFSLQEQMAVKIAYELQLTFANTQDPKSQMRPTNNSEAYNLYITGVGYLASADTKEKVIYGMEFLRNAIKHDPGFADAYSILAEQTATYYNVYNHTPYQLHIADSLLQIAEKLNPAEAGYHIVASYIAQEGGDTKKAILEAQECIREIPDEDAGYYQLGWVYYRTKELALAATNYEEAFKRNRLNLQAIYTAIDCWYFLDDSSHFIPAIADALPLFENYHSKHPEENFFIIAIATMKAIHGSKEEGYSMIEKLMLQNHPSPWEKYQVADMYAMVGDTSHAMPIFREIAESWPGVLDHITTDPDLKRFYRLPDFQALANYVNKKLKHNS